MKLSNLIVIFLALALPIILVLSVFVSLQVDAASLRGDYDSFLINATHEMMLAFEMNTNSSDYSAVADSKIRDIEAARNVFYSSYATQLGVTGSSNSFIVSYVPALLFTLYDGYYIYTPTKVWNSAGTTEFTHELKPYVYYSKKYLSDSEKQILTINYSNPINNVRIVINYSLDNYVTVYISDLNRKYYQSRAGYLATEDELEEIAGAPDTYSEVKDYYEAAKDFTEWFNKLLDDYPGIMLENPDGTKVSASSVLKIKNGNSAETRSSRKV